MMLEQQPGHQQCAGGAVSQEEAVEAVAVLHQLAVDHNSEVRSLKVLISGVVSGFFP